MPTLLALWWWLAPDYMAVAGVAVSLLTLIVATWIALKQTAITNRQGEIAESQHRFWQKQLAQRPNFRVTVEGPGFDDERTTDFTMWIYCQNLGGSVATNVRSLVALGGNVDRGQVNIRCAAEATVRGERINGEFYMVASASEPSLLFPGPKQVMARIATTGPVVALAFHVLWRIHCEEGDFPDSGFGRIEFECSADGAIKASGPDIAVAGRRTRG